MPADVFLSYARATNTAAARAVRDALVARGIDAFLDEHDIALGERFRLDVPPQRPYPPLA